MRPRVLGLIGNHTHRIHRYHFGPTRVTPNKDSTVPPIWGTIYISEVNGAMKVKSDAQVAMNNLLDPVQKFYSYRGDGYGGQCP